MQSETEDEYRLSNRPRYRGNHLVWKNLDAFCYITFESNFFMYTKECNKYEVMKATVNKNLQRYNFLNCKQSYFHLSCITFNAEMKLWLLLWRKGFGNLASELKTDTVYFIPNEISTALKWKVSMVANLFKQYLGKKGPNKKLVCTFKLLRDGTRSWIILFCFWTNNFCILFTTVAGITSWTANRFQRILL